MEQSGFRCCIDSMFPPQSNDHSYIYCGDKFIGDEYKHGLEGKCQKAVGNNNHCNTHRDVYACGVLYRQCCMWMHDHMPFACANSATCQMTLGVCDGMLWSIRYVVQANK